MFQLPYAVHNAHFLCQRSSTWNDRKVWKHKGFTVLKCYKQAVSQSVTLDNSVSLKFIIIIMHPENLLSTVKLKVL
jgi:hypothetical protein